ncbi:MAG: tRNA (adenosine(37)-N6)-threonylcarbamoyltransferase complex dimerization subunit type 1 TsaB [Bacillota bacterium]|nr:tRNA (adenosine(37)-N6)-threonylcarbamoyltransferase complex dimerization subunit type 1 TsaB [Bacillota bacterium]
MIVLGIESSTETASCAVLSEEKLLGEYSQNIGKTHSENLMTLIDNLIIDTEINLRDISGIAITKGPGSYTGLRIGIAIAKSMSQSLNLPILSISTLESLAYNLPYTEKIINPILDARSNRIYTGFYKWQNDKVINLNEDSATTIEEHIEILLQDESSKEIIFIGNGVEKHKEYILSKLGKRCTFACSYINSLKSSSTAQAGIEKLKNHDFLTWENFNPIYLRKTQAERNKV